MRQCDLVQPGASGGQGRCPCTPLRGVTPLRTPFAIFLGLLPWRCARVGVRGTKVWGHVGALALVRLPYGRLASPVLGLSFDAVRGGDLLRRSRDNVELFRNTAVFNGKAHPAPQKSPSPFEEGGLGRGPKTDEVLPAPPGQFCLTWYNGKNTPMGAAI